MGCESVEWMKKAGEVYAALEDEESRDIFKKKFLYHITGEDKYWLQIIMNRDPENYKRLESIRSEKIIIYGAGNMCQAAINSCRALGHTIKFICDRDKAKQGTEKFGIMVISPEELIEKHPDATIVVGTSDYTEEVVEYLRAYFGEECIIPLVSQVTLEHQLKQYLEESIMEYRDGEVFVDCGCYDFESSERLMNICKVDKIYAFEPDAQNLEKVKKNIAKLQCQDKVEVFQRGLWDRETSLYFTSSGDMMSKIHSDGEDGSRVEVVALDHVIQEKVTFIKMDIEGSEMKALQGGRNLIQKYKPKLAISIYHKRGDLVDIPAYIHELVPEYKLFIRHYFYSPAETVLYATI